MLKVRDIMTPTVVSVCVGDSAASVADTLAVIGISGVPVRDDKGALVGVLSQSDLINPRLPGSARHPKVEDLMTADVLAVHADDPALDAAAKMAAHDIHRIFVVGADRQLVGVVTALDIVKAVAREESFERAAPTEKWAGLRD